MDNRIEEILKDFDFEKVRVTMSLLDWAWFDSENTPSTYELIKTAGRLLRGAIDEANTLKSRGRTSHSTGGFQATAVVKKGEIIYVDLKFIVTDKSWSKK